MNDNKSINTSGSYFLTPELKLKQISDKDTSQKEPEVILKPINNSYLTIMDKIKMAKEENVPYQLDKLLNTVKNEWEKISQAVQENVLDTDTFNSIEKEALNFDLLEEDIEKIQTRIQQDGYSVLGSRLILDNEKDLMEIKTYSQKGEKSFVNTVSAKVKKVSNIPADILDEIESKGRVEISVKFDD